MDKFSFLFPRTSKYILHASVSTSSFLLLNLNSTLFYFTAFVASYSVPHFYARATFQDLCRQEPSLVIRVFPTWWEKDLRRLSGVYRKRIEIRDG